jgi:predicted AlkP superfamily phosphohydrolase/phosphomutase
VEFDLIPTQSLTGIVRFYLKQVHPEFQLYVTPINLDPMAPPMPISTPDDFAAELAEATGRFYTQGMPEDTKSLTEGVLSRDEFLQQARLAGEEIISEFQWVLSQFDTGLLFYYFGNLDQVSHMMWRTLDPDHPAYDPQVDPAYADVIPSLYERMDKLVGETLDQMGDDTTLVVMSDHGFTSWRRAFHLNTWLREHGYLVVKDPSQTEDPGMFTNVDWSRTRAYGLGINALYLNLEGRERNGIVPPSEREALMEEIAAGLLAEIDPATGTPAVTKVYRREQVYHDRGYLDIGPDLVVGYAKGTRCSNESALGELTAEVYEDNLDEWSGDHLMDHEAVPGILFTNRPLAKPATALQNLAAAILAEFGIEEFPVR